MDTTFDAVYDYMRCPLIYNLKYVGGIEAPPNLYDQFEHLLKKSILYFHYRIMDDGTVISSAELKRKWESLWWSKKVDPKEYMLTPIYGSIPIGGHKNRVSSLEATHKNLALRGWSILNKFYRTNHSKPGTPVAIDMDYRVNVGNSTVGGAIDLARVIEQPIGRKIELLILSSQRSTPTNFEIRNDLKGTFQAYAFRKLFEEEEDALIYYHLEKGNRIKTIRTDKDFKRAEAILSNVVKSIEEEIYFPRHTFFCHTCYYDKYCEQWI